MAYGFNEDKSKFDMAWTMKTNALAPNGSLTFDEDVNEIMIISNLSRTIISTNNGIQTFILPQVYVQDASIQLGSSSFRYDPSTKTLTFTQIKRAVLTISNNQISNVTISSPNTNAVVYYR